ncbi:hypothetical protein F8O06_11645 [Pseudoclavibacter sp. CFCC 14310]|uniref:hypothetical protein n=1 Tax=Pseudoclavibacter sp. CFCC 14310 TaxID=2615180 RepID=UPI0013018518|nr:hypothetical protein [Pseudoclavibacter sp. CFCC 14310]KAB1643741.1 hypothetical protein F8O06_11645 [Pseudoclavibacter sp. CFCC 14310]
MTTPEDRAQHPDDQSASAFDEQFVGDDEEQPVKRQAAPGLVSVLRLSLLLTAALAVLVAIVGGLIGWSVAGWNGVLSALVGAALTLAFAAITAGSLWLGSRQGGISFLAIVLGGWIVKIIVFIGLLALITSVPFVVKGVLFGSIVAAVLGSLAADSFAAMRAKVPYVDDPQ